MTLSIIQHRRWSYAVSGILFAVAVVALLTWGLRLGLDFTGGSLLEVEFLNTQRPETAALHTTVAALELGGEVTVQPVGEYGALFRFASVDQEVNQKILQSLGQLVADPTATDDAIPTVNQVRFESIGPAIGQELRTKSTWALTLAIVGIISYIAWAFRKVGRPVASWKYGVVAVIALAHDVVIVCGIFAILGKFLDVEINTPFIAAILTILGYSVNDTIVVFDRTRENLHRYRTDFEETVNISVNETMARSVNTTLTTLLAIVAVLLFGGTSIQSFALALAIGIFFGAYSSIFVASPLLVTWQKWGKR